MQPATISVELLAPTCDAREVFCTGSHDDWITSSRQLVLQRGSPGLYRGTAAWSERSVAYKYHLGDWDTSELTRWGTRAANRHYAGEGNVRDYVPQFSTGGSYYEEAYRPRIELLPANLPVPPPFATRRIAALLPYDYERSQRRYPVLYLQDGQNLFDEFAPYGNWELDRRLAWLAERGLGDVIVVAIDHAREKRIAEFTPPYSTRIGRGEADAYGRFLVDHLKPLIDRTYRTAPERQTTAIGGSSMGALASLHVAMTHCRVFAKAMLLSPSIWVDPGMVERWPTDALPPTRVFLYGGMAESPGSAATFARLEASLRRKSTPHRPIFLASHFEPDAEHNEYAWGEAFPRALAYLFGPT